MSYLTSNPGRFTYWPRARYPLNRKLHGSQGLNGLNVWRIEKSVTPIGIPASDRPARSVSAIPTTLSANTRIERVLGLISSVVRS